MKKIFSLFLALVVSIGTIFAESGTCGDNLTWELTDGVLTISGSGSMYDYSYWGNYVSPWRGVTQVIIDNGVTSIGKWAFFSCSGLTSITIPNSVTSIGQCAFEYCSSLTSIEIPNSVTSIGDAAFAKCTGLTSPVYNAHIFAYMPASYSGSYTIPDGIESIVGGGTFENNYGGGAFFSCSGLTSITIPKSVTSIGRCAFYECTNINSVTMESTTPPTIGSYCFCYYDYNTNSRIPYNVSIFVPCGSLEEYKSVWYEYASKLQYESYPYSFSTKSENGSITKTNTETICDDLLVTCTATPNRGYYFVKWADGNTDNPRTIEMTQDTTMEAIFDYMLEGKCGKDSVLSWEFDPSTMALTIKGKGALSENYTYGQFIKSLTIGNEVTTIGLSAFYGCNNLKNVIIGSSVKVLEEYAFAYCSTIEAITCYSQRPPTIKERALDGLGYSTIVYVPANYLETYIMHDAWGLYDVRPLGELVDTQFIINYLDKEASVINNEIVTLHLPQAPEIPGFTFIGWRPVATVIEGNAIAIEAIYEANEQTSAPATYTNPANPAQKLIRNGNVYILTDDHTYTLTGQEVK